jgi:hypothetical protein
VRVAAARVVRGGRCAWLGTRTVAPCTRPPARALRGARGGSAWSAALRLPAGTRGTVRVVSVAEDAVGNRERPEPRRSRALRVRGGR